MNLKPRKVPQRTCVVTKEVKDKKDLIRITATKDGNVQVDLTGKAHGRGAYLSKDLKVVEKARKTKALDKKLNELVPDSIFDELIQIITNEQS